MPGPENKPELIHADDIEPTDMPAKVEDNINTVLVHRPEESGVLFVRALHGEQSVISVAISSDSDGDDVDIVFPDGTRLFHTTKKQTALSPLPLQTETQPQLQPEQQPAKEKKPTITLTGSFVKDITYHQVNRKNKKTQQPEKQWLHKFLLRVPSEIPDTTHVQIVTSLGPAAERHKKMNLQPGEEVSVKGYMQDRTNTKTGEKTEELFAFTIRRTKPQEEQPDA